MLQSAGSKAERALDYARKLVRDDYLIEAVAEKLNKRGKLKGDDPVFAKIERIREAICR